jgi:hypothetical protein
METNKQQWLARVATERAEYYYTQAYKRWALELSHDKNVTIAKDVAIFVVNELLTCTDDEFWSSVRKLIIECNHSDLYKP